ncbi:L-seryl-tRNA(Sec) selenium transferase [Alteribacillus sp. HJP-4]|uniref:L-seryl-tRNA(Sec) selenium transferase n=1 Tax=Alteribacillus sp. HJP-4 TaxID=2775394 RepID=UPI0035CD118D
MYDEVRRIPPVHEYQKTEHYQRIVSKAGDKNIVTDWLRWEIDKLRNHLMSSTMKSSMAADEMLQLVLNRLERRTDDFFRHRLSKVINGTGTILHTNFGRALLSEEAAARVVEAASSYTNLEYNIDEGRRGSRHEILEDILIEVTGAEAAMVVNNNAAAVFLTLSALAKNREVIVSRGQLVEIGGSFRVSSIMEESGAKLVEVGTTNKTHPGDYEEKITEQTAMLMKVHTSNFKTIGFTSEVSLEELREISRRHNDPIVYEDLGSGALFDFSEHGIGEEPTVRKALQNGADLVSFSGDKLLGGPQAGIIAGKKQWVDLLKKHQLARVLRVDKMTLAALEATLKAYMRGTEHVKTLPAPRMILETKAEIAKRVQEFISNNTFRYWELRAQDDVSMIGGGTMPEVELPTMTVVIDTKEIDAHTAAAHLRLEQTPAIIVRVAQENIVIDFRTVAENEADILLERLQMLERKLTAGKTKRY